MSDLATQAPAPAPAAPRTSHLKGVQKVAIFLISIGQDRAAEILKVMRESEVTEVMAEIARLNDIDAEMVDEVIEEFHLTSEARRHISQGGVDYARTLLEASLGPDRAAAIFEQLSAAFQTAPFDFLRRADPRQILSALQDEHPQTIAVVLAHMNPDKAAVVLSGLEESSQRDVAVRLARMEQTSSDIIAQVESALERRMSVSLNQSDMSAAGGVQTLVDILNRADRSTERLIFEGLDEFDDELAESVRSMMFVFEDIVTLDDRDIQQVVRQVDTKELALALKGVKAEVRRKILDNMSTRAAESLDEEVNMLGAVRLKMVEEAQASVVRVIRSLEEAGTIVLTRSGDEFID